MSNTSANQRYETFTEWHAWAKTQYPNFRIKKKKKQEPNFTSYEKNGN